MLRTAGCSKCESANRNTEHLATQVCFAESCVWEQLHDFSKRKMQKGILPVFFEKSKVFRQLSEIISDVDHFNSLVEIVGLVKNSTLCVALLLENYSSILASVKLNFAF